MAKRRVARDWGPLAAFYRCITRFQTERHRLYFWLPVAKRQRITLWLEHENMIDWRSAVTWLPGLGHGVRDVRTGMPRPRLSGYGAARVPLTPATVDQAPWAWTDLGRALLWAGALCVGGFTAAVVFRLLFSMAFAVGEVTGHVKPGTFDALMGVVHPFGAALTSLCTGILLCAAVVYGVYRTSIRRYRLPWSALYVRHAGWRTYAWMACLFVPIALGGAVVNRITTSLTGAAAQNPEFTLLTRGVPASPGNFLLLFVLLVVVLPVAEELFFRAFLYRMLRNELPAWAAAAGSALAYAGSHGVPGLMPWLFFMGIAYALIVERTRSVFSAIVVHGMVNALAVLSMIVVLCNW